MRARRVVIGGALVVVALLAALILVAAVSVYVLDASNGTLVSSGLERRYLLYVPPSYDRTKPTPLVISMHGAGLWPAQQMSLSGWNRLADENGFIVVYPSGTGVPRSWSEGDKNVRFISDVIDTLEASYNIDPTRIYANGFSNGGGMALKLSCALSNRLAAVGTVAPALLRASRWCTNARAMPLISFHGTADPLAPYNGGTSLASPPRFITGKTMPFESVQTWRAYWVRRNGCGPKPAESSVATDVTRIEYTGCAEGADVVLYVVKGGGHSWPGGKPPALMEWWVGPTSRGIDASSAMWAFFREHRLPGSHGT